MAGLPTQKAINLVCRRPALSVFGLVVAIVLGVGAYQGWIYARTGFIEPRARWRAAQQALERHDFSDALEHLKACAKAWPDDVATHFLLARTARRAGKLNEAEKYLFTCEHLSDQQPSALPPDTKLEWALLQAERGKLADVENYLRARLRESHPDSALILETLSWKFMWSGRLKEALSYLDLWLKQQPGDHEALVRRGWVYEHLFNGRGALEDYKAAVAVQPDDDDVRLRVTQLLLSVNQPTDAWEYLEPLLETRPNDTDVRVCLARYQRLVGRSQQAEETLSQVLTVKPGNVEATAELGVLRLEKGNTADAERLLREAYAKEPYNRLVAYSLGQCLERLGKREEVKAIKVSMERHETDVKRLGSLIDEVMKRPYDPSLRYEIGMIFLQNGFRDDGLRWLGTALKADPTHKPTHQALAEYYDRAGQPQEAARHRAFVKQPGT